MSVTNISIQVSVIKTGKSRENVFIPSFDTIFSVTLWSME